MNQIGFNQKHKSKISFSIKNFFLNFLKILFPISLSFILIYSIFKLLPHSAWIYALGTPQSIEINNFEGRIDIDSFVISSNEKLVGDIINSSKLNLTYNNKNYVLNPGDLQIQYGKDNFGNSRDNIFTTSPIQIEMLDMKLNQFTIEKKHLFHKFDNISSSYTVSALGNNLDFSGVIYDKEFTWEIQGNCGVYIYGKKLDSNYPFYILKFKNINSQSFSILQFNNFSNLNLLTSEKKGKILFTGQSGELNGFFKSGDLNYNQTTNEKKFSLNGKSLNIVPSKKQKIKVAYTNLKENRLELYGNIVGGSLTGNSLFLDFRQWAIENASTVIGTLIAMLLGLIVVKRN